MCFSRRQKSVGTLRGGGFRRVGSHLLHSIPRFLCNEWLLISIRLLFLLTFRNSAAHLPCLIRLRVAGLLLNVTRARSDGLLFVGVNAARFSTIAVFKNAGSGAADGEVRRLRDMMPL